MAAISRLLTVGGVLLAGSSGARHPVFVQLTAERAVHPSFPSVHMLDAPMTRARAPALVALSVPMPQPTGLHDLRRLVVVGAEPSQLSALETWPDGSVHWLQLVLPFEEGSQSALYLTVGTAVVAPPLALVGDDGRIGIDTGPLQLAVDPDAGIESLIALGHGPLESGPLGTTPWVVSADGAPQLPWGPVRLIENGSLRVVLQRTAASELGELELTTVLASGQARLGLRLDVARWTGGPLRVVVPGSATELLGPSRFALDVEPSFAYTAVGVAGGDPSSPIAGCALAPTQVALDWTIEDGAMVLEVGTGGIAGTGAATIEVVIDLGAGGGARSDAACRDLLAPWIGRGIPVERYAASASERSVVSGGFPAVAAYLDCAGGCGEPWWAARAAIDRARLAGELGAGDALQWWRRLNGASTGVPPLELLPDASADGEGGLVAEPATGSFTFEPLAESDRLGPVPDAPESDNWWWPGAELAIILLITVAAASRWRTSRRR